MVLKVKNGPLFAHASGHVQPANFKVVQSK
jgi:hypothetical protein